MPAQRMRKKRNYAILCLLALLVTGDANAQSKQIPTPPPAPSPIILSTPIPIPIPQATPTPSNETLFRPIPGSRWVPMKGVSFKDVAPQWITILAGFFAGVFAYFQWLFSHKQRRDQFDRKEQQDLFTDIQDRFTSADQITRASATLRLGEFGRSINPGAFKWFWQSYPQFSERNYPFFRPVAAHLATALHIEQDADIRTTIKEAFATLSRFARQGNSYYLQLELIRELADANEAAERTFIRALAHYHAPLTQDQRTESENLLLTIASFHERDAPGPFLPDTKTGMTRSVLQKMRNRLEYVNDQKIFIALRAAQTEDEQKNSDKTLFPALQTASAVLIDTRDALAYALKDMTTPPFYRLAVILTRCLQHQLILKRWKVWWRQQPRFTGIHIRFLVGADLSGANLIGADLSGVNLSGANLHKVNLSEADLITTNLSETNMSGANLSGVNLSSAGLIRADLSEADLSEANLRAANLSYTILSGANLLRADFSTVYMVGAYLYGIKYV